MSLKAILDQSNWKMAHKNAILVYVPLSLALLLIAGQFALLELAKHEVDRQAHSRKLVATATELGGLFFESVYLLSGYILTRSEKVGDRYDAQVARLPEKLKELADQVRDDPAHIEPIKRMQVNVQHGVKLLDAVRHSKDEGSDPYDVMKIMGTRAHLVSLLKQFMAEQQDFTDNLKAGETPEGILYTLGGEQLKRFLAFSAVAIVAMGLLLWAWVSRPFSRRLNTLVDNALRFQHRQELHPTLHGSDELAQLDSVFHGMAKERNDAEELIKESEARVRLILESMPVALLVTDPEGKIEAVNIRTEQMLGYSSGNLVGNYLNKLLSEPSGNGQGASVDQIFKPAFGRQIEAYARRNSGENLPVELSSSQLQMRDGPRLLVTMLDVTERHEIERLKKEFVNMISHDLKTPLTSIVGNLALVSAEAFGPLTERGKHMVSTSEKQAERLISLINDLLLLEKMEAGGFELHVTRTDLAEILEQSKEAAVEAARERSIVIEIPETETHVYADSMRLIQVMVNLLSNAIKFSPDRGVVKVLVEEEGEAVKVQVIDQGRGIPLEHRKAIFEKFKQVELSDSREKGGTGLGLPICKLIIEKHGGTIGVESEEGIGSTFWFRIPKSADLRK
jgi:PAS domain S-box-containing protein